MQTVTFKYLLNSTQTKFCLILDLKKKIQIPPNQTKLIREEKKLHKNVYLTIEIQISTHVFTSIYLILKSNLYELFCLH